MTGWEIVGLMVVVMTLIGALAGRRDKKVDPMHCERCGWPRVGVLPCLCADGTPGRYEGGEVDEDERWTDPEDRDGADA